MKNFAISTLFILVTGMLNAQHNTYFGLEIGVTNDRFEYFDDGDIFVTIPLNNLRSGVLVGHSFNNLLSIETGFVIKNYTEGFGFQMPMHRSSNTSSSIRTWQIPFRIKPRVKLFSDNLFFTPTIGFHYCINRDHLFRAERSSFGSSNFVTFSYTRDYT